MNDVKPPAIPLPSQGSDGRPAAGGLLPVVRVSGTPYVVPGCVHFWPGPALPIHRQQESRHAP